MTPDTKTIADMGRQAIADHSTIVALREDLAKAGLQIEAMLAHNADLHTQLQRWQTGACHAARTCTSCALDKEEGE